MTPKGRLTPKKDFIEAHKDLIIATYALSPSANVLRDTLLGMQIDINAYSLLCYLKSWGVVIKKNHCSTRRRPQTGRYAHLV